MKTFLDCLTIYDDSVVDAACRNISREAREFPPSAGEVRAACEKIMLATQPHKKSGNDYKRPLERMTPEEAEASKERVREMVRKWKRGLPEPDKSLGSGAYKKDASVQIGDALIESMFKLRDEL